MAKLSKREAVTLPFCSVLPQLPWLSLPLRLLVMAQDIPLHGSARDSSVPERMLSRTIWVEIGLIEKVFVADMYYDTLVSQREVPHGSTGSSGSGREFQR